MARKALVTGINGQDGSYLAQLLLQKGYHVVGGMRRTSSLDMWRLDELGVRADVELVPFELLESESIRRVIEKHRPDEIYNLAAQSFVGTSFDQPQFTSDANAIGVLRLLESIRAVNPQIRFYQASTSEMFGKVRQVPQDEMTPFHPRSPYGVAKLYGHWITVNYREAYGMHASCGILFNHESPLRGPEFVTRKITIAFAKMRQDRSHVLELGNMAAQRDWGHARDYVDGIWRIVQLDKADDFVLATGQTHTVQHFVDLAAQAAGFIPVWEGEGEGLKAFNRADGRLLVRVNSAFFRPAEVDLLIGSPIKAEETLGWRRTFTIESLVEDMVKADIRRSVR